MIDDATSNARRGRLPWPARDELTEEQLEVYRSIVEGPRARGPRVFEVTDGIGRLEGPFNAMLVNPNLGKPVQEVGAAVRYASSLNDRQREIAILELAFLERCDFEWYAHERLGRVFGLGADELEALRTGAECLSFSSDEAAARSVVRSLHVHRDLDDTAFDQAKGILGYERLADLVVLVGYYEMLSLSLAVWRTPLPDGVPSPWGRAAPASVALLG